MGPFEKSESSSIAETDVGRERDTTWMTSETLTFEERSRLMHQDHEKWWKEVNERHEKESRSPSSFFSAIFFLILWVIFSVLLLVIECAVLIMGVRLFLSTNKEAHRNDVSRTLKFWIIVSIIFISLFVVDFFTRQALYSDFLFQLGMVNIGFRTAAILLVSIFLCQIMREKLPGDTQYDGYVVSQQPDPSNSAGQYPMVEQPGYPMNTGQYPINYGNTPMNQKHPTNETWPSAPMMPPGQQY
ncbi:uncharacterized protein LOC110849365 isoform X2 [Folsomia candida]|nr:uncharacterized protein LOC110849365 isoform X2 [Folsomia candida]